MPSRWKVERLRESIRNLLRIDRSKFLSSFFSSRFHFFTYSSGVTFLPNKLIFEERQKWDYEIKEEVMHYSTIDLSTCAQVFLCHSDSWLVWFFHQDGNNKTKGCRCPCSSHYFWTSGKWHSERWRHFGDNAIRLAFRKFCIWILKHTFTRCWKWGGKILYCCSV